MGGVKAKLGRLLGKLPKKGSIVTIKGTQKKDSLFGNTNIPVFGKLKFKGIAKNETLSGQLLNNDGISIGTIRGVKSTEDKINYNELYPKILKTIQDNIYSKHVLQTKEWATFEKEIEKLCNDAHDDIELFFGFNMLTPKLPFTHLTLLIAQDAADDEDTASTDNGEIASTKKSVVFEEKNGTTAYLQIKNFTSSTNELAAVLPKIVENAAYKNLIIDLRDNGGGGINAAFALAKYIVTEDLEVGYFPTNKLQYSGYQPELFNTLSELQPKSTNEFGNELKTTPGVKLIFKKPTNRVFTGKIYVLTNGKTGSTCEPIVYALKNRKKATIIGEKTAGAMLAASPFVVSEKYMFMLPIADFYTYDGIRLDKVGVSPDIEVKSEEALNKALEIINIGKN
ncbi:MAG: S41 family peptidase [Taibaiella sp.]